MAMPKIFQVVGLIWAIIGALNLVMMPWTTSSSGVLTFGLIFNFVLFILPGLIVFGIGKRIGGEGGRVKCPSCAEMIQREAFKC